MTYRMRTEHDCGPSALAYAGGWDYALVLDRWPGGWKNRNDIRDDLNDSPDDHRLLIEAMGKHQQMVTLTDLIGEQCPKDKTVVLLHSGLFAKHWVVWHNTDETGLAFHWGDGTIRHFPFDKVVDLFTKSAPNCAYKIVDAPPRLSWWQRIRRFILGIWARLT